MNPYWIFLTRLGSILGVTISLKTLHEKQLKEHKEIKPHRIYSSHEASVLLEMERREVVGLLVNREIRGRMVNGNYRIPGSSLLNFLQQSDVV